MCWFCHIKQIVINKVCSKTHKRLEERFLIGRNRTKRANFRGSPLFQATYKKQQQTNKKNKKKQNKKTTTANKQSNQQTTTKNKQNNNNRKTNN